MQVILPGQPEISRSCRLEVLEILECQGAGTVEAAGLYGGLHGGQLWRRLPAPAAELPGELQRLGALAGSGEGGAVDEDVVSFAAPPGVD